MPADFDEATRRALLATIDFFESRGKATLKEHDHERTWYADFLEFVKRERIFATLLTPAAEAAGDPDKRWDTARISAFSEITGFYGLAYWYTWQVTILGLGPIWQSDNAAARRRAAELLEDGAIFAFGLSEKEHGADIYSTDMVLTPDGDGGFTASGSKYYIGNGNLAGMVSVFGRRADVEGPDGYVFFAADSRHPAYRLVKNVVNSQNFVSEFRLEDYPVGAEDILHTGKDAFYAALNTVNVGKFNLGFASIGICEHAFYEAITHADGRILYGHKVTEFPHVRQLLSDAYARLVAMKLFGDRAIDYFRSRGPGRPPLSALQPDHEDEGDHRGREGDRRPVGRDRRQGLREGHVLRDGRARHPRAPEARGHGAREHGAGPEVHGQLPVQPGRVPAGAAAARRGRRRVPVPPGAGQGPRQDPVPRLARELRAVRRRAERRPLHGAGRGPRRRC